MFIKSYHLVFLTTLLSGTLLAISANSWFTAWLGLEMNLMSMAPLMLIKISRPLTEAAIKYFLTQAMASTALIASALFSMTSLKNSTLSVMELILFSSLAMKAGVPPFHFWFPEVSNKLNWFQCFILFTWQKVAPLLLLSNALTNVMSTLAMLSVMVGAVSGLNQLYLKTLLAYSSISHSGWLIMSTMLSMKTWVNYFVIYTLLSLSVIFILQHTTTKKISHLTQLTLPPLTKYAFSLNILSLGGLPPLLGFLAKISVLTLMAQLNMVGQLILFVFMSLISLFYYLRLTYSFTMSLETKKIPSSTPQQKMKSKLMLWCATLNIAAPLISFTF